MPRTGGGFTWRDLATADPAQLQAMGIARDDAAIILGHEDTILPSDKAYNVSNHITLAGGATAVIVRYRVPPGCLGIVRFVAMQTVRFRAMGSLKWQIRTNEVPVYGFDDIVGPFGIYLFPRGVLIPLFKNATVDITCLNPLADPVPNVHAMVTGHTFASGAP